MGCGATKEQLAKVPPPKKFGFRVKVIGGLNLYNNGFGMQIPGTKTSKFSFSTKSDPYVKLSCDGKEFTTTTVIDDCNPTWNEEFFFAAAGRTPILKIRVHDSDIISKNDVIGSYDLNLHGIALKTKVTEVWVPLTGSKSQGEIGLQIVECYRMKATAVSATEVAAADAFSGSSDCYLSMNVGQQTRVNTEVHTWTRNPVWNESFYFYVPYGVPSTLELILWDKDKIGVDTTIGWRNIKLDGKPKTGVQPPQVLPILGAKGTLTVILEDETVIDAAEAGPVTDAIKAAIPPSAPQTCNFNCRVVGAYNLAASDQNVFSDVLNDTSNLVWHEYKEYTGSSDPFVRVECEGQCYDTAHINKTLEPQWNETFTLICKNKNTSNITLKVFDHDLITNDALGAVTLPLNMMKPGECTELWSFLDHGRGEVGLELSQKFQIKVSIVSAEGLPAKDLNGLCDPFVKLSINAADTVQADKKWFKTRVVKESVSPAFEEDFRFPVDTVKNHKLEVAVYDGDFCLLKTSAMEEFIGRAEVAIDKLLPGVPLELTLPLLDGKKACGSLKVIIVSEIPIPPSALNILATQGKEAFAAATKKLSDTADFIKTIRIADPDNKVEEEIQPFDPKVDKRPRFSRVKVSVVAVRGLEGGSAPYYVGVAVPTQGQRFKTSKEFNSGHDFDVNESFQFGLPTKTTTALELSIFESSKAPFLDKWSATTFRKVSINFRDLNNKSGLIRGSPANDTWLPLPGGGEIGVRVEEMFRFHVRVVGGNNLNPRADCYVTLSCDNQKEVRTGTRPKHPKGQPQFGEGFTFFTTSKNADIKFTLKEDEFGTDGELGKATQSIGDLRRGITKSYTVPIGKGGELIVIVKEEEKMGLLDSIVDAAGNAAKLAMGAANEVKDKISGALGSLGGMFGK